MSEPCVSGEDFMNSVVVDEDCGDRPSDPRVPKGVWYCDNPECPVREVTVEAFFWGPQLPKAPPPTHCGRCKELMRFLNYVREVRLLRCGPEA
jgi:hypothetical protein